MNGVCYLSWTYNSCGKFYYLLMLLVFFLMLCRAKFDYGTAECWLNHNLCMFIIVLWFSIFPPLPFYSTVSDIVTGTWAVIFLLWHLYGDSTDSKECNAFMALGQEKHITRNQKHLLKYGYLVFDVFKSKENTNNYLFY